MLLRLFFPQMFDIQVLAYSSLLFVLWKLFGYTKLLLYLVKFPLRISLENVTNGQKSKDKGHIHFLCEVFIIKNFCFPKNHSSLSV